MQIKILAFGITKDILGERNLQITLSEALTVAGLRKQLMETYPGLEKLKSLAIAINGTYAEDDIILDGNDEVVLIPPVSGG